MTEDRSHSLVRTLFSALGNRHDYLPAAGHDALLPAYDLMTRLFGFDRVYRALLDQAQLGDGVSVLEVGCGTGNLLIRARRSHPA